MRITNKTLRIIKQNTSNNQTKHHNKSNKTLCKTYKTLQIKTMYITNKTPQLIKQNTANNETKQCV